MWLHEQKRPENSKKAGKKEKRKKDNPANKRPANRSMPTRNTPCTNHTSNTQSQPCNRSTCNGLTGSLPRAVRVISSLQMTTSHSILTVVRCFLLLLVWTPSFNAVARPSLTNARYCFLQVLDPNL